MTPPGLLLLATHFPQMGAHSGYHLLAEAVRPGWHGPAEILYRPYHTPFPRLTHKLVQPLLRRRPISPAYNYLGALFELRAQRRLRSGEFGLAHMLFVDNDYHLLANRKRRHGARLVGSVHKPSAWWRTDYPGRDLLRTLDGVICMSTEQIPFFREHCAGPIEFQRLGLDLDFFRPAADAAEAKLNGPPRFLCCGSHLRDFDTLATVIELAARRLPDLHFDIVAAEEVFRRPTLARIINHPAVHLHHSLSDPALLALYQQALAFVVPLQDTAANNAVSEAVACGLPLLVTDLTGVRDYSTPEFAQYIPPAAAEEFVRGMETFAADRAAAIQRGAAARAFAGQHLGLPTLAAQAIEFYQRVLGTPAL